jgi:glycosyltransferase involved in cell wall biosynthesis
MKKNKKNFLSIVVPAFKQWRTIKKDLSRIDDALKRVRYDYEIICVVDGRIDKTFENAKKYKSSKLKVVGYQNNHGKGYAIRYGMVRAKGNIIAFIDAGMDLDPNGLSMLLEHFEWYEADIIIGSKRHPVSKVQYPWQRKILSIGYQLLIRILFGLQIRDSQVGMKFFRREVLENVLPRILVKHYAFDIEILAVAHRLGYNRIFEAPVNLDWTEGNSILIKSLWYSIYRMLIDTAAIFYRLKILRYYDDHNRRLWKYDSDLNFKINIG